MSLSSDGSAGDDSETFMEGVEFPLHRAAQLGRDDILQQLIKDGAFVNLTTFDSVTPLHDACLGGHSKCVKLLLEAGANIDARNIDGATPLCDASNNGSQECVQLLIDYGAKVNIPLNFTSPLHEAVLRDNLHIVHILIKAGSDLNASDIHFGTPLHVAVYKGHTECAHTLLVAGADVNACKNHESPLHIAAKVGIHEMVFILLDFGANVFARNNRGHLPMDIAKLPHDQPTEKLQILLETYMKLPKPLLTLCRLTVRQTFVQNGNLGQMKLLMLPKPILRYLDFS